MQPDFDVREEVAAALAARRPVVALESTLIAHGLPWPRNLETARAAEAAVREAGAVPATVGLLKGRVVVGLSSDEIERFARAEDIAKASTRDLAALVARGGSGATTVAATLFVAARAGIRVFATGGIGGVHRDAGTSFDISADLAALARCPGAVVAAGAKAILDLPATLEALETLGVPVVGYRTDAFPAFYARSSGLALETRVDTPEAAAGLMRAQAALGLESAILFANPPPAASALDPEELEGWIRGALAQAEAAGLHGKAVTPYLLARLAEASGGRSLAANEALIRANAALGGAIAVAYAALSVE